MAKIGVVLCGTSQPVTAAAARLVGLSAMRTRTLTRHGGAARLSMDCSAPLTRAIRRSRFARSGVPESDSVRDGADAKGYQRRHKRASIVALIRPLRRLVQSEASILILVRTATTE